MTKKQRPVFWIDFTAGGLAASVGATITCPLEVVKTRLQSSLYSAHSVNVKNPILAAFAHIKGVSELLGAIKREEGIRALWKGLGPNLVGVIPARAIYFSVYSQGKHMYTKWNDNQETSFVHLLSAATASSTTSLCTNPIWLVKTRMQLQSEIPNLNQSVKYRNSIHCATMVIKQEGIRGLYKGFSASLLGLSESTFQFVVYEKLKKTFREQRQSRNDHIHTQLPLKQNDAWIDTFGAAAIAKLLAAGLTYPHEVLRTRLRQSPQTDGTLKYVGLRNAAKLIYKEEGIRAFYGGMTAHLLRTVPNAAIMFLCYELFVKVLSVSAPRKEDVK